MMDAATRDELNALRRRAYGPAADIETDPVALARLGELEDLARPAPPEPPDPVEASAVAVTALAPTAAAAAAPSPAAVPASTERANPRIALGKWGIAGVVAATVSVMMVAGFITSGGIASPPQESAADSGVIHVPVMIMASTGGYVDLSTIETAPDFPVRGKMSWAQPLGEYYGWSLWIGGADTGRRDQSCLLLTDGSGTRGRCVSLDARTQGELVVSLPYERIPLDQRPAGMTQDESVRFTWSESGFVTIVVQTPSIA